MVAGLERGFAKARPRGGGGVTRRQFCNSPFERSRMQCRRFGGVLHRTGRIEVMVSSGGIYRLSTKFGPSASHPAPAFFGAVFRDVALVFRVVFVIVHYYRIRYSCKLPTSSPLTQN